jgi:hypothetical protein
MEPGSRGVLDTPQEPVIGLAEGETRWRGTTVSGELPSGHTGITGISRDRRVRIIDPETVFPVY